MTQSNLLADGRFLRGETWKKFSIHDAQADFYVSANGNDSWSGTLAEPNAGKTDGPFATIGRAQKAVRQLKKQVYKPKKKPIEKRWIGSPHSLGEGRDILVLIREGYYSLNEPIHFAPEDGGERCETDLPSGAFEYHKLKDYFITYAAYPGEYPVISGGKRITGWKRQGDKWRATVKGFEVQKLIANGRCQILARTPDHGFFLPEEHADSTTMLKFRKGDVKNWDEMQDNRIIMLLRWHTGVNSIAKVDEKNQIIHLKKPQKGILEVPVRYYVENIEALLTAPGEWYFNKRKNEMSYIPAEGLIDPNQALIAAPVLSQLIEVKGTADNPVRNLRFYGLTFEATNPGNSAITFGYAHNCELADASLRNLGGNGIVIASGCYRMHILNNTILGTEGHGILVSGIAHPEKWMDSIRETFISYNRLMECGSSAIGAYNALFITISHNEITRNLGRTAISLGGWRNLEEAITGGYRVEYNHLHHVQEYADDSGAITTSGMTYDSIVRRNLVHDVKAGFFNDNVALWFDNMSSGWIAEDNIYYNLEQSEMKLCAANLVDNLYRDNFLIDAPVHPPETVIEGDPQFVYSELEITNSDGENGMFIGTGEFFYVSANIANTGATGIGAVNLFIDGKLADTQKCPVIHGNSTPVRFKVRFPDPGVHALAIGTAPAKSVTISGESLSVLYDHLTISDQSVPAGEKIRVSAQIENVKAHENSIHANLIIDGKIASTLPVKLAARESKTVAFNITPPASVHQVQIGQTIPVEVNVYPYHEIDLASSELHTYCSGTAKPCEFKIDREQNHFRIQASGTDFYHAEDSYGAIYLKKIKGDFVATVKVARFGKRTHEWFRAGLFIRNDISQSFETEPGSPGSLLLFTTPGRAGIQWDEHGDGCMHKASSQNHAKSDTYPVWLKLVRHGDSFSGYISFDGENWVYPKHTGQVPEIADSIDVGLAAGSCDQTPYFVEFEDFKLIIEDKR